jgi:hypothetical protein
MIYDTILIRSMKPSNNYSWCIFLNHVKNIAESQGRSVNVDKNGRWLYILHNLTRLMDKRDALDQLEDDLRSELSHFSTVADNSSQHNGLDSELKLGGHSISGEAYKVWEVLVFFDGIGS